jgi:ATP-dependent Clp protease protease subunit
MSDIEIMGTIGWDVTASDISRQLKDAEPGPVTVRINSPGGSVFDGIAIASMLRRRGDVTAIVDGLAASAASIIAIGADRRVMAPGTLLMIHNPWSMAGGNADDLRKEADVLDVIASEMSKLYADASGGKLSEKDARKLMDEETWLTAEDAMAVGLVHAVEGKAKAMAAIDKNRHAYRNVPKGLIMEENTPAPKAGLLDTILAKLGGGAEALAAKDSEIATLRAEASEASAALVDAAAKITEAKAEAEAARAEATAAQAALAAKDAEIEAIKAEHVAALEAAKIEGGQEAVKEVLETSAPEALPHAETVEGAVSTHTAKYNALRAAGKHAEAGEYRKAHKLAILKGE